MKQDIRRTLAIVAATALLSACGGGGGGGGVVATKVGVSGVASKSAGPGAVAAGVTKQAGVSVLPGAKVTILSYDTLGNLFETVEAVTGSTGAFNAQVSALPGGGTVSVKVQAADAIVYEKSFPYKTAADLSAGLQVDAVLDPVSVKVIPAVNSANFDKAAIAADMVSMAVVKDAQGASRIVANSEISAAKAAGGEVTWQLDVAKSVLAAAGATELTVKAQNYNPAVPDDMTRFPADSADTGERLVSASFDFIDIKDQNGNPLVITKAAAKAARKSAAVAYAVRKMIPDCNLILKDENATKAGVQIGFYFMRNGKWQKLGESTLYDSIGSATTNPVLHTQGTCTATSRPYAVLTDADVSKDIDFDLKWFNFDYVAFGVIKTDCVEGVVNQQKADNSIAALGGISLNFSDLKQSATAVPGFQGAYGYSKADGKFRFDFTYSNVTLNSPTANIFYTDPVTWLRGSKAVTLTTKNANGCYEVTPITIVEPACSVSGRLMKSDGSAAAYRSVNVYEPTTYSGSRWTQTDAAGNYSFKVMCSTDYNVSADGATRGFNVNSVVGTNETSDNGSTVVMKDIVKVNNAPAAYISADKSSVGAGNGVNLSGYGYDPDYDPLTYAWTTTCGTFTDAGSTTAASTSSKQNTKWTAPATVPANNICTITLTVSDGSKTGSATSDIYVSATGNRPPIITYLYAPTAITAGRSDNLLVSAYDANPSDILSYSWTSTCGTMTGATTANPVFTAPQTSGTCNVTVTVTDNATTPLSTSKTATITVNPNQAPVITSMTVTPSALARSANATLAAGAYDINNDNLTWNWSIVSGGGSLAATGCSGSGTGSVPLTSCSYTAPNLDATVVLRFTVSDGINAAVTRDQTISVSSASGTTNITVQ